MRQKCAAGSRPPSPRWATRSNRRTIRTSAESVCLRALKPPSSATRKSVQPMSRSFWCARISKSRTPVPPAPNACRSRSRTRFLRAVSSASPRSAIPWWRRAPRPTASSSITSNSARSASLRRTIAGRKSCRCLSRNSAARLSTVSPSPNSPRQSPTCSTPTSSRLNKKPRANPRALPRCLHARSTTRRCFPLPRRIWRSPAGFWKASIRPPATRRSRPSGKHRVITLC